MTTTQEETGMCDCGATYNIGSRIDHNGDEGLCWDCSDIKPETMTSEEWDTYLLG